MMGDEFWDKKQAASFLRVSRATLDRYVAKFDIQKSGVAGGRRVWFRAEDIRSLISPLKDGSVLECDVAAPLVPTATTPELSRHLTGRQRGRASGRLVLPASAQGEHALLAYSLVGVLATEAEALGAYSLMLAAAPLAARFVVQMCRRPLDLPLGTATP